MPTNPLTQKVTLTLPIKLLQQVDKLAAYDYSSRSDIVRQALIKHLREPGIEDVVNPQAKAVQKMYEAIKGEHPYLNPNDKSLIKFLYEEKMGNI